MVIALSRDLRGRLTEPRSDAVHLSAAMDWLFQSQDATDCGGSAAYYGLLGGWAGPYPETSGYIVPTLFDYANAVEAAGEEARADRARRRGRRMADWLLTTQLTSGAFPGGVDPAPGSDPSVFNTGQILFGLVRAAWETGDRRFLDATERAGTWLAEAQHVDGYWDRYDYRGEIHSYCSRVAWALLEAHDLTGIDAFAESAVANLEWVNSVQTDTDWFEFAGFSPAEVPYLHTIAYTVRGLLEGGLWLDDERFVSAARDTADRLLDRQQRSGPLQGTYDRSWSGRDYYCLTGNAQMALVWLRLYERLGDQQYLDGAITEIEFLKTHQSLEGPAKIHGAIKGSHPVWQPYMRFRYPNWAAKFFADALLRRKSDNVEYH